MKKPTFGLLKKWIRLHDGIRANFCVTATYERRGNTEVIETEQMYLQTTNYIFLRESNLNDMYDNIIDDIIGRHENIQDSLEGTQWVLISIDTFRININRYDPLMAGSFIELPKILAKKKAIVNIENYDNQCFKWHVLAYLHPVDRQQHPNRVTKYMQYEHDSDN